MPRIVREAAAEVPSLGVRLSAAEEARKASGGGILNSMPVVHAMHRPFPHALKIKKRGACAALLSLAANTVRLLLSFPMVTVLSTSAHEGAAAWRTPARVLLLNSIFYVAPSVALVGTVSLADLSATPAYAANVTICGYIGFLLLPVCLSLAANIRRLRDAREIPGGTFCFRPAHRLRRTGANAMGVLGILVEFAQLSFFVLPRGVFESVLGAGSDGRLRAWVEMRPQFLLDYEAQFWAVVAVVIFQNLVVIARVLAKGHAAYIIASSRLLWLAVYTISGPLYVSIVVCLIRALDCDYTDVASGRGPPRLNADRSIVCWSNHDSRHSNLVFASLFCLALYLPQVRLLTTDDYSAFSFLYMYLLATHSSTRCSACRRRRSCPRAHTRRRCATRSTTDDANYHRRHHYHLLLLLLLLLRLLLLRSPPPPPTHHRC